MKYIKYILIIVFPLILLAQGCIKEECKINGSEYQFVLNFTLSPAQETYHIGDTITISSTIKNPVYERVTGNYYVLEDFKFYLISSLKYMDTLIADYSDFNRFELLIDSSSDISIFTYSDGLNSVLGQYIYQNDQYFYSYKLVMKEKGSYLFLQGTRLNYKGPDQNFEGKCRNVENNACFYMNERSDNNSLLLDLAVNPYYAGYSSSNHFQSQYLDNGGYCFKVID